VGGGVEERRFEERIGTLGTTEDKVELVGNGLGTLGKTAGVRRLRGKEQERKAVGDLGCHG
jgi:hypothetical protein